MKDLTGRVCGRLTVEGLVGRDEKGRYIWSCRCQCGNVCEKPAGYLGLSRPTRSCGCLPSEIKFKHGGAYWPEFAVWEKIVSRCERPTDPNYRNYGGRGIRVHPDWVKDFGAFIEHMGRRQNPTDTVERLDNDQGYVPGNVVWADRRTQGNNTRRNIRISHQGKTQTLAQWCRELNMHYRTVYDRVYMGWDMTEALTTPIGNSHASLTVGTESKTYREWEAVTGLSPRVIRGRVKLGWPPELIISTPVSNSNRKTK